MPTGPARSGRPDDKLPMAEGAPLPPSFARFASLGWSPLPADAGRDEMARGEAFLVLFGRHEFGIS